MPAVRVDHMFRDALGQFGEDTSVNRRALLNAANNPENFIGTDRFGADCSALERSDGTQVWVQVRGGKIALATHPSQPTPY
jgi:hypothetical protein